MPPLVIALSLLLTPPAAFDRPYEGELVIEYAEPADVTALCKGQRFGKGVRACSYPSERRCRIVFPKETSLYTPQFRALLMRHEIAHCNGWVH